MYIFLGICKYFHPSDFCQINYSATINPMECLWGLPIFSWYKNIDPRTVYAITPEPISSSSRYQAAN
jgi:hypothetical protein